MLYVVYYLSWRLKLRRLRKKEYEDLSDANIAKVIKGMHTSDSSRPTITKKEACQILKIAYNPSRLDKIIEEYNDKLEYRNKRKQQKRGTKATPDEISDAVQAFIRGEPITHISSSLYRSVPFVRSIIDSVGVPTRGSNEDERNFTYYLPDECVATEFKSGDVVWSAVEHSTATILHELNSEYAKNKPGIVGSQNYEEKYDSKCYAIYVHETCEDYQHLGPGHYSCSLAYDLGSLSHLEQYGINFGEIK
jgi:hypothetical protein